MRFSRPTLLLLTLLYSSSAFSQQPPQRDPQAVIVLQHAFAAMGATVPSDSVATGNVTLFAGSKTENGTIRILTRGLEQSAEQIQTPDANRSIVYSQGLANRVDSSGTTPFTLELAASSQTPCFPFVLPKHGWSALSGRTISFLATSGSPSRPGVWPPPQVTFTETTWVPFASVQTRTATRMAHAITNLSARSSLAAPARSRRISGLRGRNGMRSQ